MSKYRLPKDSFSGDIALPDGSTFYVEFNDDVKTYGVSNHPILKDALVHTTVSALAKGY